MKIEIHQLRTFNEELDGRVLEPLKRREKSIGDGHLVMRIIAFGNRFLELERRKPENANRVIWFDINFGEPAYLGVTWAYNPLCPGDARTGADSFWRIWSETEPDGEYVLALPVVQEEFASYTLQGLTV